MTTLLLVSGSLRTFRENKNRLGNYDLAVYVSKDDEDTYLNVQALRSLYEEPRVKVLLIEPATQVPDLYKDERQRNIYKQWYKLSRLWQSVPKTYETYVRIRPDICLEKPLDIESIVQKYTSLVIPLGSDRDGINDQLAIGPYQIMNHYCKTFDIVHKYPNDTSESILATCLEGLQVKRIPINYKLVLSTAKVIAIAGDSGSGKSTLCKLIRPIFLFDKVLEFETDRYHKWERGDTHWNTTTHLHPQANYLEKMEDDTFNLKLGNTVVTVDYDHSTGKFTPPSSIEPKENILLCGLHTLYSKQLRSLSDLKIYVDTSEELKTQWKLQRDTQERGHDTQSVLAKIESRRSDYETHISPQREHADLVIRFHDTSLTLISPHREMLVGLPGEYSHGQVTFRDPTVDLRKQICECVWSLDLPQIEAKPGYDGIIQFTILRALYTKHG
jgi:uridine kinase